MAKNGGSEQMAGKIVCAWCSVDMGPTEAEGTSHGICQSCYDAEIARLNRGSWPRRAVESQREE